MLAKAKGSIIVVVIALVLTVVGCMFLNAQTDSYTDVLATQLAEIDQLNTKITVAKANIEGNQQSVIAAVSGIDVKRKAADDDIFETFATKIMTWSGFEGYTQMRKDVMEEYNLSASSSFMMDFLPSRPQGYKENAADISCQFESVEPVCYHIDESTGLYSYFAEVRCISAGAYGGNTTVLSIFTYTVDENGKLGNIMAYDV